MNRTSFDVLLDTIAPESAAPPLRHRFTAMPTAQMSSAVQHINSAQQRDDDLIDKVRTIWPNVGYVSV